MFCNANIFDAYINRIIGSSDGEPNRCGEDSHPVSNTPQRAEHHYGPPCPFLFIAFLSFSFPFPFLSFPFLSFSFYFFSFPFLSFSFFPFPSLSISFLLFPFLSTSFPFPFHFLFFFFSFPFPFSFFPFLSFRFPICLFHHLLGLLLSHGPSSDASQWFVTNKYGREWARQVWHRVGNTSVAESGQDNWHLSSSAPILSPIKCAHVAQSPGLVSPTDMK